MEELTVATIFIENQPRQANPKQNLLHACLSLGYDVPYFCWHPALGSVGACRQCAVKQFRDERDAKGKLVKEDKYKVDGTTLYENPLAQDYVNRVGQSMVPVGSDKLYAFKIMLNPVPEARSLSTGTIYVSTGLLASIDNEAQLAYVLGHEIAHVEKEHWRDDVLVAEGVEDWNEKNRQQKERIGLITKVGLNIATMGMANAGNFTGFASTMFADAAMPTIFKLAMPDTVVGWDRQ